MTMTIRRIMIMIMTVMTIIMTRRIKIKKIVDATKSLDDKNTKSMDIQLQKILTVVSK